MRINHVQSDLIGVETTTTTTEVVIDEGLISEEEPHLLRYNKIHASQLQLQLIAIMWIEPNANVVQTIAIGNGARVVATIEAVVEDLVGMEIGATTDISNSNSPLPETNSQGDHLDLEWTIHNNNYLPTLINC